MKVHFIPQEEIDKVKWNSCVHYAINGNIFGYKWFLDATARDWDALIEGDYESILPLIWRKTWNGRKELFVPPLLREAGIYSINMLSTARLQSFLEAIPEAIKRKEIQLQQGSPAIDTEKWTSEKVTNYQMLLEPAYERLAEAYSSTLSDQLKNAEDEGLMPISGMKPELIAGFYKKFSPGRKEKTRTYHTLLRIMYNALHRGWGFSSAINSRDGQTLAAGFFMISHSRLYNLLTVSSPTGTKKGAPELLIDLILRTNAGKPMLLDFNTHSHTEAQRALGFGGQEVNYWRFSSGQKWLF